MSVVFPIAGAGRAFADDAALSLGGPKQRTVLAVLAVDPGKRVSGDRLIEAVWRDEVPDRASHSLSTYVSNLRGVLGDVIVRDGNGYLLRLGREQVDEAQRIARKAPSLMAQSNFNHWDELGETQRWAELLDRLGGGEPDGLTLEEAFGMVHEMLAGDPA